MTRLLPQTKAVDLIGSSDKQNCSASFQMVEYWHSCPDDMEKKMLIYNIPHYILDPPSKSAKLILPRRGKWYNYLTATGTSRIDRKTVEGDF